MSDSNVRDHGTGTESGRQTSDPATSAEPRWPRVVAIAGVAAAFIAGLLVARRLGVGDRVLLGIGLAVFFVAGQLLMRRGHGSHGRSRGHWGCH